MASFPQVITNFFVRLFVYLHHLESNRRFYDTEKLCLSSSVIFFLLNVSQYLIVSIVEITEPWQLSLL